MTKRLVNASKALRTLRKTPVILEAVLAGATIESHTPTGESWTALEILIHLCAYEQVVSERIKLMLAQDNPLLPVTDNSMPRPTHPFTPQDIAQQLADFKRQRQTLLQLLESLTPDQWQRQGVHPEQGAASLLEVAINVGLHDIDHIEQLVGVLERRNNS